jgi:hypothetical protein
MTDRFAELDAALERVIAAARAHLDAVKAADGAPDDDAVWHAYVLLNNASHDYDEQLNDVFGEVTPWDLEEISGDEIDKGRVPALISSDVNGGRPAADPYPHVVSVRQRRDYRVPSVTALVRVAEEGRPTPPEGEDYEPIGTVAEALLELLQSGDGSLGMLDVPELEPLDGVVLVAEVADAFDPESAGGEDLAGVRPRSGSARRTARWPGSTSGRWRIWKADRRREACSGAGIIALVRQRRQGRHAALTAEEHLAGPVPEQLYPGQFPAGVLGRDRELHRRGHPVDMWW